MAQEIERKFLLANTDWKSGAEGVLFRQGYLCTDGQRTVRVRLAGDIGYITIKGRTQGISRLEFEYQIPAADANELLDILCHQPLIEKTRYRIEHHGHVWEVDEFHGVNQGLIVAEIELGSEGEAFEKPPWIGEEVSGDPRYFNSSLVTHPYADWR